MSVLSKFVDVEEFEEMLCEIDSYLGPYTPPLCKNCDTSPCQFIFLSSKYDENDIVTIEEE